MRKIITCIILVFVMNVNASQLTPVLTDEECLEIIKTYQIEPKIKSVRGWKNVFKSEKWRKIFKLDGYTIEELDCLEEYILANAMVVKKYNRFIGMELKI